MPNTTPTLSLSIIGVGNTRTAAGDYVVGYNFSFTVIHDAGIPYINWSVENPDSFQRSAGFEGYDADTYQSAFQFAGRRRYRVRVEDFATGGFGEATIDVDVKGPNEVQVAGLNTNSTGFPSMGNEIRFKWSRDTVVLGPHTAASTDEKIKYLFPVETEWSPWGSPLGQGQGIFYFDSPDTVDKKKTSLDLSHPQAVAEWDATPANTVIKHIHQVVRINIPEIWGQVQSVESPTISLKTLKVGPENVKIITP
jgi:hypothetical protein